MNGKTRLLTKKNAGKLVALLVLISLVAMMVPLTQPAFSADSNGVKNAYINGSATAQNGSETDYQPVGLDDTIVYEMKFDKWLPLPIETVPNPEFQAKAPMPGKPGSFSYIDLAISNDTPSGKADISDVVTYTISALNKGEADASNVKIIDVLPAGTTLVANSVKIDGEATDYYSYDPNTRQVIINIGAGAASDAGGRIKGDGSVSTDCNNSYTITFLVIVNCSTIAENRKFENQSRVIYECRNDAERVQYTNYSNVNEFSLERRRVNAVISDVLPAGLTYVSHTTANNATFLRTGQACAWTFQEAPASDIVVTITVKVAPVSEKSFVNFAKLTVEGTAGVNTNIDTNHTYHTLKQSVTYKANGGTGADISDSVAYGQLYVIGINTYTPPAGLSFAGWNTEADGNGVAYASGTQITIIDELVLHAQWSPNPQRVTYKANGGIGADKTTFIACGQAHATGNNTFTAPTGRSFVCWNTEANGSGASYAPGSQITVMNDVVLYAQWEENLYTVTYRSNGGTGVDKEESVTFGQSYALVSNPFTPPTGWGFSGWNTTDRGLGVAYAVGAKITITGDTVLYARWSADTYKVTYKSNGGTGADIVSSVTYGQSYSIRSNTFTAPAGQSFVGWNTAADGKGTVYLAGTQVIASGNATLYAQWSANVQKVTYSANGGTGADRVDVAAHGQVYTIGNNTFIAPAGQSFNGWNTAADGSGYSYAAGVNITINGDVLLFAQWRSEPHTVTYKANGGAGADLADSIVYGKYYTIWSNAFTPPSGSIFSGWNTAPDGTGTAYAPGAIIMITDDIALYAQWGAGQHTVTYKSNGGIGADRVDNVTYGQKYTITSNPFAASGQGWSFSGWNTAPDGSGTLYFPGIELTISSNLVYYAQWSNNLTSLTVTYKANGGIGADKVDRVSQGQAYSISENPFIAPSGQSFAGWCVSTNGNGAYYPSKYNITIGGNLVLYAQWTKTPYRVSYNANGGTGADRVDIVTSGKEYAIQYNYFIAPTGRNFVGWNTAADGKGTAYTPVTLITITGDLMLYAQWSTDQHKVTYKANGGIGVDKVDSIASGQTYSIAVNPFVAPTGLRFVGWNVFSDGKGPSYMAGAQITISGDIVLYAQWSSNPFSVTYKANGGTGADKVDDVASDQVYTIGDNLFFAPAGRSFIAWNLSADGKDMVYPAGYQMTITSNIVLYAMWTPSTEDDDSQIDSEPVVASFIDDHVAYVVGYPDGSVRPGNNITRAEVATVFYRLLANNVRDTYWTQTNSFTDINANDWYNNAISVMNRMGIVNGYPGGSFNPNGSITRAELAAIVVRFARAMDTKSGDYVNFSDISGHWAQHDILFAASIGWVTGYPNGTFRPKTAITRAEFMTIVNRMLKRVPMAPEGLVSDGMVTWRDNMDTKSWYYLAVQEATNSHVSGDMDTVVAWLGFRYEFWVSMVANPDWPTLEKMWAARIPA